MKCSRARLVAMIMRRYPFYSGCGRIANSKWARHFSGTINGEHWCRVHGGELLAPLDDWVGRSAFFIGDLDPKLTWIIKKIVQPGDTVFDIGANIGIVTVLLAKLAGNDGSVHSFEPNPDLCKKLAMVVDRNRLQSTTIHPFALGEIEGLMHLSVPSDNAGAASLVEQKHQEGNVVHRVPVRKLDDVCKQINATHIRLIKLDVEGFERSVLDGARAMLQNIRPDAILFELNSREDHDFNSQPIVKILREFDYDFFSIPRRLIRMKLLHQKAIGGQHSGHDFLACPKGAVFEKMSRLMT